jgi:hypothetical protein
MTAAVCTNAEVRRRFASPTAQRCFSARHTCSSVISGFFPPQPFRVVGDEGQRQQTQQQVPHQCCITPAFKVREPDFRLAHPKRMLDGPTIMPSKMESGWKYGPAPIEPGR